MFVCDKRDRPVTFVFCCDLHLSYYFWYFTKRPVYRKGEVRRKKFFKQDYCHACHTRFAVFFHLPSCCVSSLIILCLRMHVKISTNVACRFRASFDRFFSGSLSNFGPSLRFCGFLLLVVRILINTVHGCSNSILALNITYLK